MKRALSYLLFVLLFSVAFQSCGKKDDESAYAEWKQKNEKFIDEIRNNPSLLQASIPQGPGTVYYKDSIAGKGDTYPLYTSQVKVRYKGRLINDYVFDDASERITTMNVNSVVSGFSVALQNMKEGDKWEIYIPWDLGYGAAGKGSIPPYSALIFELELVEISVR